MSDSKASQSVLNQDPEKALDQGLQIVKQQSYYMRSALDAGNLRQALKFSSGMLNELRSAVLTPRLYYQLYVSVFDQLRTLESYFAEEHRAGRKMATVYQKVQHASNIVPRLYLLITVGAAYIESREAPAHQILKDLLQMVKGVQHPIRGLFLRYYLLKTMKQKLPDKGTPYEGEGGDIDDAVTFILQNLSEMNRLWVRLGYIGGASQKQKRELERKELRVTVGENIIRLSSLEGLSLEIYEQSVQPRVLQIITACKDSLAQQYLMDCMIQAFPDEYHLHTLDQLLDATTNLLPSVDSVSIFVNLIQRLTMFSTNAESSVQELLQQKGIFQLLQKYTKKFLQTPSEDSGSSSTSLKKLLQLLVSLIRFSIKSYPMKTQYVNEILQSAIDVVRQRSKSDLVDNQDCLKLLQKLLSIPLDTLSLAILDMNQYPHLMQYLTFGMRRQVANGIVTALLKSKKTIDSLHTMEQLLEFITPLLKDQDDYQDCEVYEFQEEQQRVAKLIHIINLNELTQAYHILQHFKQGFLNGGNKRKKFTIPALIFGFIKYSIRLDKALIYNDKIRYEYQQPDAADQDQQEPPQPHDQDDELDVEGGNQNQQTHEQQKHQKPSEQQQQQPIEIPQDVTVLQIYQIIAQILPQIAQKFPEVTLRLYLQSLQSLSSLEHNMQIQGQKVQHMAYDLASEAFTIYQDELSESQSKFNAINLIMATFSTLNCLSSDDYDTLAKNATQYAAKQLKKPTQSEAVLQASHLFWNDFNKSEALVMQCLSRSSSIANVCLANPRNLFLLVKLIDKYLYFFANDVQGVAAENINPIIETLNKQISKISGDIGNADANLKESFRVAKMHYQETVRAIKMRSSTQTKYAKINFDY